MHFAAAADFDYTTLAIVIGCFLVVFPALWFGITWLISRGWRKFSAGLECPTTPEGISVNVTNVHFGGFASYNNVTTGTVTPEGIHLCVSWFFKTYNPAMFVPWDLIECAQMRSFFIVTLRELTAVSHGVKCRIRLTGAAWQKVRHLVPPQFQMD